MAKIKKAKKVRWASNQTLWIGDPEYVLNNEKWQKISLKFKDKYKEGLLKINSTFFGDGAYGNNTGQCYDIDSGTIAIVPYPMVENFKYLKSGREVWVMEEIVSTEIVRINNELHFRVNQQTVEILLLEELNHVFN